MQKCEEPLTFYYHSDRIDASYKILDEGIRLRGHKSVDYYNEFLIDVYVLYDKAESNMIALDWDNTVSADQDFFIYLIPKLQAAGYEPFVCTLRAPDRENIKEIRGILEEANIAIYLTNGSPKRDYMKELDVDVHMWIDDFYPGICGDSCSLLERNDIE